VPEKDIVETLIEEAMRIAESMERDGEAAEHGSPQVTVG
jgi:(E)-4-hydroxy-3-methylbut-2-enyl-diphosphate synthase